MVIQISFCVLNVELAAENGVHQFFGCRFAVATGQANNWN